MSQKVKELCSQKRRELINRLEAGISTRGDQKLAAEALREGVLSLLQLQRKELKEGSQNKDKQANGEEGRRARRGKKKPKGHGRLGSEDYPGGQDVHVPHPELKPGDLCPDCHRGHLYCKKDSPLINLFGNSPIGAIRYLLQRLRCSACQKVYKSPRPKSASKEKAQPSAKAAVVLMKYGLGIPFNRLQRWQQYFGVPLPDATQFEMVEDVANCLRRILEFMESLAADAKILQLDDTGMPILSMIRENRHLGEGERYGMHATAILTRGLLHDIHLYYFGRQHAGENLSELLDQRSQDLQPPLQMGDASSRNTAHSHKTLEANCQAHAFRNFVSTLEAFPKESRYILSVLSKVFANDRKTRAMTPQQRLAYHRKHSRSSMTLLHIYLQSLLQEKAVEPNSSLGRAIKYMLKRWQGFTRFLEIPGAPLDNNLVERALKLVILLRKGAMFFKNSHGATIASILMSVLATAVAAGTNPMDYLIAVQQHKSEALSPISRFFDDFSVCFFLAISRLVR